MLCCTHGQNMSSMGERLCRLSFHFSIYFSVNLSCKTEKSLQKASCEKFALQLSLKASICQNMFIRRRKKEKTFHLISVCRGIKEHVQMFHINTPSDRKGLKLNTRFILISSACVAYIMICCHKHRASTPKICCQTHVISAM